MKIALLSEKYTPDLGGLAISAGRLSHLLSSAGHNIRVFAPTSGLLPSEKRTLTHGGVSVTRFGARKRVDDTLVDWFELLVEEHGRDPFDVLHGYFLPQGGFVAAYAGKYLGIRSVVSIRGNDVERAAFDPSKFSHVMYALQNADAMTTNACELMKKAKAFIDRDVTLIPNGVDVELFKPMEKNQALAEAIGLTTKDMQPHTVCSQDRVPDAANNGGKPVHRIASLMREGEGTIPVIGFVGELREKKGLRTLLIGYAQVNEEHPSVLLIVGELRAGEDQRIFDDFLISSPNSQIIVTGCIPHNDLPAYYSLIDVFVHPSLRDGMPNAVLEAMACEKAVIASAVGGMLDVIEDGKNGLLLNVNDANALADAISDLLGNPEKRLALGSSARKTIVNKFVPKNELEANLTVYRKIGLSF